MFTITLNFMADLAFEMGDIDSSCYFYNQCVVLGKHTLNYKVITQGYYGLSLCSQKSSLYPETITIIKKCL